MTAADVCAHALLAKHDLLSGEHLVDKGYTGRRILVDSPRPLDLEIVGPVADDPNGQARVEGGQTKATFPVD